MNNRGRKHLKKVLDQDPSCYILITCSQLSEEGEMQVEMTYQGDSLLATYLLQEAQSFFDLEEENNHHLLPNTLS